MTGARLTGGSVTGGLARRLRMPAIAFVAVFAYGIAGYMLFGFAFIDALYMTALALTTAGFNAVGQLTPGEKAFTVSIAVFGVTVFLVILAVVTSVIAEGSFGSRARRRRMQRRIDALKGHVIVCAYGRVGRAAARELEAEGVPFVVVDRKDDLEDRMRSDGVLYVLGEPTSEEVLRAAGIERARAIVCALDDDADNVYITVVGRSMNPSIFVVARASARETPEVLYRAGANRVLSPYVTSGRHMAAMAIRPRVVDLLDVAGERAGGPRLEEVLIEASSPLAGMTLDEVCGEAVPLLLRRASGEAVPNPSRAERVGAGDVVLLFGEPKALRPAEGHP